MPKGMTFQQDTTYMATAKIETKTRTEMVPKVIEEKRIILNLSADEALFVATVIGATNQSVAMKHLGLPPTEARRAVYDELYDALGDAVISKGNYKFRVERVYHKDSLSLGLFASNPFSFVNPRQG